MKLFWYSVVEDGPSRYACKGYHFVQRQTEAKHAAVDAAEDYHANHDGWESRWPLTFAIYESEDGPELHRFLVEREHEPTFYAYSAAVGVREP